MAEKTYPVINNDQRIYGYTHSAPEALQQIKFLQNDFAPQDKLLPLIMPSVDINTLADQHTPSEIYFVELSSAKELQIDGSHVQLNYLSRHFSDFFSDKHRAKEYWHVLDHGSTADIEGFLANQPAFQALSSDDKYVLSAVRRSISNVDSLKRDMREIRDRVSNVVFLTHCNAVQQNALPIASRARYIEMTKTAANELGLPIYDPTVSMQAFGQNAAMSDPDTSLSHYAEDFAAFVFDGLYQLYVAPFGAKSTMTPSDANASAIEQYIDRRVTSLDNRHASGVTFITGSLGAGGAERQMTRLAVELQRADPAPIEVIVSNLASKNGRDFFLPKLESENIPVSLIDKLPASSTSLPDEVAQLVPFLPPQTALAVQRLVPHLLQTNPRVAYIWQDGAVLTSALSALIAGVPRIIVSLRGMPPNLRPEMMRDGYFDMYTALSKIDVVTLSANTQAGADAYAAWLGLDTGSIQVVHNAAEDISTLGEEADITAWAEFERATADADFTFGGVFRFDQNKRPFMWLEYAAAALVAHPASRFVLVGDGAEFDKSRVYANELGIAHRCLFVGKSRCVGFWLTKLDALGLLSKFEGLPNVLIEAQLSGVPVISTPAGGAAEAFLPDRTGFLLSCNENPDLAEFLGFYLTLATDADNSATMGANAKHFASDNFDMGQILDQTRALFLGAPTPTETKVVAFG